MNVFIVSYQHEDGETISHVSSTRELAEKYERDHPLGDSGTYNDIQKIAVDEVTGSKIRYTLKLDKLCSVIGEPYSCKHSPETESKEVGAESLAWDQFKNRIEFTTSVIADSLEDAVQIASERVLDIIAAGEWHVTDI